MAGLDETYLAWESTCYPDGGKYEGLMKDGQCHGKGVFQYADGDRFEGEYFEGQMDGMGVYSIFKGQWKENNMHGCGKKWYPGGAIEEGEWIEDNFVGDYGACDVQKANAVSLQAEQVAVDARDFMYKPDGDVGFKEGLKLQQDPVIYTVGTEYLMPGPAGNLFSLPDDPSVRKVLSDEAKRKLKIYNSVNIPPPTPEILSQLRGAAPPDFGTKASSLNATAGAEDEGEEDDDEVVVSVPKKVSGKVASISISALHGTGLFLRAFAQGVAPASLCRRRKLMRPRPPVVASKDV